MSDFGFLQFRDRGQHAQCSTCVRHRAMIKGLGNHLAARREQLRLFHLHLRSQYLDRMLYWEARGISRQRGHSVTIICDGMDQSKFELPRHPLMVGKEFGNMNRPRMHVVACIAHGRFCMFIVSLPDTKKDGSASVEIMSHALTCLERQGCHLPSTDLILQHDNTSREFKNHNAFRWAACQVARWQGFRCFWCVLNLDYKA